jgi:TRAP-type mannitol/chloroaromatic compound transport system permease large subunit
LTICTPIFIPIGVFLGFDSAWFAIIYILNVQMACLTSPFGWALGFSFNTRGGTSGNTHAGHLAVNSAICGYPINCAAIDNTVSSTRFVTS